MKTNDDEIEKENKKENNTGDGGAAVLRYAASSGRLFYSLRLKYKPERALF